MRIAPVSMGYIYFNYNYNVRSVYGNPRTLGRVDAVSDTNKRVRPLVVMQENAGSLAAEESSASQKVSAAKENHALQNASAAKEGNALPKVPAMAQGGFADMLKIRYGMYGNNESKTNRDTGIGYLKDAMNVMMMGANARRLALTQ